MTATTPALRLPPQDSAPIRALFQASGRAHVAGLLAGTGAEQLHACLRDQVEWQTAFHINGRHVDLHPVQYQALDQARRDLLGTEAFGQAAHGFGYVYNNFPIADKLAAGQDVPALLRGWFDFLNSPEFLNFARQITGLESIAHADAQATLYRPGHFLTCHDDGIAAQHRLAAYVLNLTPEWSADWGGNLLFHGADGHIQAGYVPRFNALNLFAVPMPHSVSMVTPLAPVGRYSITGWLRAKP